MKPGRPDLPAFEAPAAAAPDADLKRRLAEAGAGVGFASRTPPTPPAADMPTQTLNVLVPVSLARQLRLRAAEENVTVRHLVHEALRSAGYEFPELPEDGRRRG
jgi:hypothetical protein